MAKPLEIKEFAERVERLCDFLLARLSDESMRDGSHDVAVIEQLKQDAADIQFNRFSPTMMALNGLDDHMRGMKKES
jgi:hypothetical protein